MEKKKKKINTTSSKFRPQKWTAHLIFKIYFTPFTVNLQISSIVVILP